jgi:hypothetical protein
MMVCVSALASNAAAQIFPDTVYAWRKAGETLVPEEEWYAALGDRAEIFSSYAASELRIATYERSGKSVRIEVAQLPSRERAFGLFRAMVDGASPSSGAASAAVSHGIIGDAFAYERSAVHVNFGPFYLHVASEEKRASQPPDEALVVRMRRLLFSRADCYGSDFPLPTDERVLGTERYLPPDSRAWVVMRRHVPDGLLPVLSTHAAFSAEYDKGRAGIRRTVMQFPFRQKEAAAGFAAELVQQLEVRMGTRIDGCALPAFIRGGVLRLVTADPTRVFLVISSADDGDCCDWARGLLRR